MQSTGNNYQPVFIVTLDTYVVSKTTGKAGKVKVKETKVSKMKELSFAVTNDNYLEFLTEMLSKHGKTDYRVSDKRRYTFKHSIPPAKTYVNLQLSQYYGTKPLHMHVWWLWITVATKPWM